MANKSNGGSTAARDPLLMDVREIAISLSVGVRTLWSWVSGHKFPAPDVSVGTKFRRWKRSTVLAWLDCEDKTAECVQQNGTAQ
jgi:predicted DNA-binding transcriptional regulator AlpA